MIIGTNIFIFRIVVLLAVPPLNVYSPLAYLFVACESGLNS